jgi:hypothetical protein
VNEEALRTKLGRFFGQGFPRELPRRIPATLAGNETIEIDGGRGRPCTLCEEIIPENATGSVEYRYPSGTIRFHRRCEEIWHEERHRRAPSITFRPPSLSFRARLPHPAR